MCLGIPCKIISVSGDRALVSAGGTEYEASVKLLEDVTAGDYVLLHTGFAIQKISEEEAEETFNLLRELEKLEEQMDSGEIV